MPPALSIRVNPVAVYPTNASRPSSEFYVLCGRFGSRTKQVSATFDAVLAALVQPSPEMHVMVAPLPTEAGAADERYVLSTSNSGAFAKQAAQKEIDQMQREFDAAHSAGFRPVSLAERSIADALHPGNAVSNERMALAASSVLQAAPPKMDWTFGVLKNRFAGAKVLSPHTQMYYGDVKASWVPVLPDDKNPALLPLYAASARAKQYLRSH